jgi:hypothetical protein
MLLVAIEVLPSLEASGAYGSAKSLPVQSRRPDVGP